ncbi:Metallo-dependent phosphatase [Atractiella rhizophila]|nr:Metallo-dependent phosphatase [Atractiella rhizophila]
MAPRLTRRSLTLGTLALIFLYLLFSYDTSHFGPLTRYRYSVEGYTPRTFRKRIVAIGDIHGDLPHLTRILRLASVADHRLKWSGKKTILVQTGDIVDRGRDTIAIYKLMESLREGAAKAKGQVVSLLGNHEYMNALGDWRYVTPEDVATFGSARARRQAMTSEGWIGQSWLKNYSTTARLPYALTFPSISPPPQTLDAFPPPDPYTPLPDFPPYSHPNLSLFSTAAASFVHGGLSPAYLTTLPAPHLKSLNEIGHSLLEKAVRPVPWTSTNSALPGDATTEERDEGPVWWRGFATENDERLVCEWGRRTRELLGVRRLVMGHTPFLEGIKTRCNSTIILIDTGLSTYYSGSLSALEILYSLVPQPLLADARPDKQGRYLRNWMEREVISALYENRKVVLMKEERFLQILDPPLIWKGSLVTEEEAGN